MASLNMATSKIVTIDKNKIVGNSDFPNNLNLCYYKTSSGKIAEEY